MDDKKDRLRSIIREFIPAIKILFISFLLSGAACSETMKWKSDTTSNASVIKTSHTTRIDRADPWAMSKEQALHNAQTILDTLTLQEKIGQLFFIAAEGKFMHQEDKQFINLIDKIQTQHVGGILFFKGTIYGQAHLTNKLQQASSLPLWITQDMEFGAAMRVRGTTKITPAMGIAASGKPKFARQAGYITAREARALGVHQIFAPVVDVNNNPQNPVINVRSYGGTPELVSRFSNPFIEGVKKGGVLSTAKHFPGHGDTHIDSHVRLPIIYSDYQAISNLELIPFRSAIQAGVESVMSAHISFPKISGQQRLPATMDPKVLHHILRDSLQFDGLVVTDALEMQGITDHFTPGEAALKAIEAGSDMLLISPDATAAIHHVLAAVKSGRLSEARIDKSVQKLLQWKFRWGLFTERTVNIEQLSHKINPPNFQTKAEQIARHSITVLSNKMDIMPLHSEDYSSICAIALADDKSGDTGSYMARVLRRYHSKVRFHTFDRRSGEEEKARIRRCARQSDLLVIGSLIYVKTYQDISLNREQRNFIETLSSYQNPEVLISFGNPYIFKDIPHAEVDMQAWAPFDIQIDAAVQALFGASRVAGSMPIRLPGHFDRGDGIKFPQSAPNISPNQSPLLSGDYIRDTHRKITRAISDSLFPGATLMIMENGRTIYHKAFGYQKFNKEEPLTTESQYALPELTSQLVGVPYVLADLQSQKLNDSPSKGGATTTASRMPEALLPLFSSRSVSDSVDQWSLIENYHTTRHEGTITAYDNSKLWRPLEMRHTRLKTTKESSRHASFSPVLQTTSGDLNKLLFTMMNYGRYKNRQILQNSLTRDYLAIPSTRKGTYKVLGKGPSRIWLDKNQQRAILLLIKTNKSSRHNSQNMDIFRQEILERINQELSNSKSLWDLDASSSISS